MDISSFRKSLNRADRNLTSFTDSVSRKGRSLKTELIVTEPVPCRRQRCATGLPGGCKGSRARRRPFPGIRIQDGDELVCSGRQLIQWGSGWRAACLQGDGLPCFPALHSNVIRRFFSHITVVELCGGIFQGMYEKAAAVWPLKGAVEHNGQPHLCVGGYSQSRR